MILGYVIRYPEVRWGDSGEPEATGRIIYYSQSAAEGIDRTDVRRAKIFPNKRALAQGLSWCPDTAEVVEVSDIEVTLGAIVPTKRRKK